MLIIAYLENYFPCKGLCFVSSNIPEFSFLALSCVYCSMNEWTKKWPKKVVITVINGKLPSCCENQNPDLIRRIYWSWSSQRALCIPYWNWLLLKYITVFWNNFFLFFLFLLIVISLSLISSLFTSLFLYLFSVRGNYSLGPNRWIPNRKRCFRFQEQ